MTLAALIEQLSRRFAAAGLVFGHGYDSAWDEVVALVLHVTGLADDRASLACEIAGDDLTRIDALARRRIESREPLAYLIGECRFAGHRFLIEPGVVIPRSPIGQLIESALAPWLAQPPARILDLCCGSGCIGIAAALAFDDAQLTLVDIDPQALSLARRNLRLHGLEGRGRVVRSDLFAGLGATTFDLIVCNPPYVDAADMASLPAEYRHEPALGLAGGEDGLTLVARLLAALPEHLERTGLLVCEVGASAPALLRRFPRMPFVWPDLPEGGEGVFLLSGDALGKP
ncbi:MAG: 50S ribosomal protein L3 N(5)-glutamine methyltransferase [Pseudomonadales bacterium]